MLRVSDFGFRVFESMSDIKYSLAIIGGGPGGYSSAIRASQLGIKTVLIEKNPTLGGTCLNAGCIPSKALLASTEFVHIAQHKFAAHGIALQGMTVDVATMMNRKNQAVAKLTKGLDFLMKQNNVDIIHGTAHLIGSNGVFIKNENGNQTLDVEKIILATGSVPIELPFLKFDGQKVLNSDHALSLPTAPQSMIIIGAGAIGLELGSVWARLGTRVTVLELLPRIAAGMDHDIASTLQKMLAVQGLTFNLNTQVKSAQIKENSVAITTSQDGKDSTFEAEKVFVAVGRRPCADDLFLDESGVKRDEKGRIQINSQWQTNISNIFAIGDLVDGPMLAHKAMEEGVAVAEQIAGKAGMVNYKVIPNIIYTMPEAAGVGFTEDAVKQTGGEYRVGKSFLMANGRAVAADCAEGFVKIIADAKTDRLLGAHILAPNASELIAECIAVMEFGGSAEDLARTMHAHPTMTESIKEAALAVGRPK